MAGEQTIDQLNIEINTEAKKSSSGMDKLIASIEKLKSATGGGIGELTGIAASLAALTKSLASMKGQSGSVTSLASSINKLNDAKTNNIASSIKTLTDSLRTLGGMDPELKTMISDLAALSRSGNGGVAENALSLQAAAAKAQATIDKSALTSAKAQEGLQAIADKNKQIEETASAAATHEQDLANSIRAIAEKEHPGKGQYSFPNDKLASGMEQWYAYEDEEETAKAGLTQAALSSKVPNDHIEDSIKSLKEAMGETENVAGAVGKTAAAATSEVASGSSRARPHSPRVQR